MGDYKLQVLVDILFLVMGRLETKVGEVFTE